MSSLQQKQQAELAQLPASQVAAARAAGSAAAANITDPVAAAKAYRAALASAGVHFGAADALTEGAFPTVDYNQVNAHTVGGFAKVGGEVGDIGKTIAPALAFIPGVGTLAALGIGAASGALGTLNDQDRSLGSVAKNAAGGAARAGVGVVAKQAIGELGNGAAGASGGGVTGAAGAAGSSPSLVQTALNFVKKNPQVLLAGATALSNAKQGSNANNLQNEALNIARDDYNSRAPLRAMAIGQLQNRQPTPTPDLSSVFADPNNPYARR